MRRHDVPPAKARHPPGQPRYAAVILGALWLLAYPPLLPAQRVRPRALPVNEPSQVTAETEPVSHATVSPDGRWLVYASGPTGARDLWLRSADPAVVLLPRRLTSAPGDDLAPAISSDARWLAYVGTTDDAKGDLFLLELDANGTPVGPPRRLTGRETADGAPAFSLDGATLYFHHARSGDPFPRLAALDLRTEPPAGIALLEAATDGAHPAPSPEGSKIAFVSWRLDPGGDLYVLDLETGQVQALTSGPALDSHPVWGPGNVLTFVRRTLDTDGDGWVTPRDHGVLHRIAAAPGEAEPRPHPLTAPSYSADLPRLAGRGETRRLFFLSPRSGVNNVWSLPADGEIPHLESPDAQGDLAEALTRRWPPDPALAMLGYAKVLERFPRVEPLAAHAASEIGRLYLRMGMADAAESALREVVTHHPEVQPEHALARIQVAVLRARRQGRTLGAGREALDRGAAEIQAVATGHRDLPKIQARAAIERARLLLTLARDAESLLNAITLLDSVADNYAAERPEAAEAMVRRADAYAGVGQPDRVRPAYLAVLERYPDVEEWVAEARERLIDGALAQLPERTLNERVEALRRLVEEHRHRHPRLAKGALIRMGDALYAADEWARAKSLYRRVLDEFGETTSETAAARLALAEILYREQRFRQALDLYETEIRTRPPADRIYRLARRGYIRKSVEAGEFLFRVGEVVSSRSLFKDLIRYENTTVEAHRGYIRAAAALGDIQSVLAEYRAWAERDPGNPVARYAAALGLTYLDSRAALEEARALLLEAIALDAQVEYFHQTLGFVLEVLETVHAQRGNLELALEAYQKAYFLNNHAANPTNAANLLLNLGNAAFLLGQYRVAFQHYSQRLAADVPFANDQTEILYYRRFGAAAFQVGAPARTVELFERARALVTARTDPKAASRAYDALNRAVLDRMLPIAARAAGSEAGAERAEEAQALAQEQSQLRAQLFAITEPEIAAVPSAEWEAYRRRIEALLREQEALNRRVVGFVQSTGIEGADKLRRALGLRVRRVREALASAVRFVELEAELLDRLGLAYQEAEQWEKAAETFGEAFALNERLEHHQNLARNRRSIAYNTYQLAGTRTGTERGRLLETAAADFGRALELVRAHGVATRRPGEGDRALFGVELRDLPGAPAPLTEATQAAFGFTADQEERLAEGFLARIALELGDLDAADRSLETQLGRYPPDRPVADGDLYGVSLLHHRAALVAFARHDLVRAFTHFHRSARFTRQLGSAASTALNVANMARVVAGLDGNHPARARLLRELEAEDREASRLIDRDPTVSGQPVAAFYHNAMAVHWLAAGGRGAGLEAQVARMRALALVFFHITAGLRHVGDPSLLRDRDRLALATRLHLTQAAATKEVKRGNGGIESLEQALVLAERGLLPELRWRALAGLGRLEEALAILEAVSPFRAHAEPGEITRAFAPLVEARVARGEVEQAFDLAERVSELERVHRLAPLVLGRLPQQERALSRRVYPRLVRIRELRSAVAAAHGEERAQRAESLDRELRLLQATLGESRERLPALAAAESRQEAQDTVLILLGLAVHAEEVADAAVKARTPEEAQALRDEFRKLRQRYETVRRDAVGRRRPGVPAGALALLGPEPARAAEVMANLSEGETLYRLVRAPGRAGFIVFRLTAEELDVTRAASLSELDSAGGVVAHDDLLALEGASGLAQALSATHWLRSFQARRPFKRSLLAVPGPEAPAALAPSLPGFDLMRFEADAGPQAVLDAVRDAHTIVLAGRVSLAPTVPTRAGQIPDLSPTLELPGGRLPLQRLLGRLPRVSTVLLLDAASDAVYPVAHLLSLAGGASVVVAPAPRPDAVGPEVFLEAYATASAAEAGERAASTTGTGWRTLGYRGVDPEEAQALARARFVEYVRQAQAALRRGSPLDALASARDALLIARESPALGRHLTDLYRFTRETAWAAGRIDLAEQYAAALATRQEAERPVSEAHAEALLRLGLVQARLERYDRAIPNLERAQEMLANLELETERVQALASLGVVLENATEYDRALTTFESAATASRAIDQQGLLAAQHVSIGRIRDLRLSQWATARQSYQRALALHEQAGDLRAVAQALLDVGRCHRLLGNFAEAARHYARALEILAHEPDEILRAKVIIERANNAWFQGRYQQAFDLQRDAYRLARTNAWDLGQVIALNTSGLIWWTLGDNDRALRELTRALELARTLEVRDDEVATTLNNIGLVYREMGRYDDALETLDRALTIDRRLKSRWAVAYDLRNLGLTRLRKGDAEGALPLLGEAAAEAGAIGDRVNEAKARLALGEALLAAGRPGEAGDAFSAALELSQSMALKETEWRALHGRARLALRAGERETARQLLVEAVSVVESLRTGIKLEQLRDGFLASRLDVYETLVAVLVDLGETASAFEVAERSRSRNFIDLLGTQRLSLRGVVERELYQREQALKARLGEEQALLALATTEQERSEYREALQRTRDEHRDLTLEIQARHPGLAALVSVDPTPIQQLQRLLEPGVALLAYYLLDGEILSWIMTRQEVTLVRNPVPRQTLERAVFDYRRLIQNLEPLEAASRELHRLLLQPVLPAMRDVRYLGIVPHGALHYLSFATLAGPDGYLIDDFPLFYVPSASVLKYTLTRRAAKSNRRVLAIGNPELGTPTLALPFAEQEVNSIRWNFPEVTLLTGARATESWVTSNLASFGIIHLASHGEFDAINPLFSAIKLARDAASDGDLRAAEVFGLEINADLVVLSACQTGLGRVSRGDDVIGLNRAFFYAGTHTIVSSLWRVSDLSTALLMKHFYRQYATRNKADSLRAAILHVKNRYVHPGYWGAFVLAGDYD